MRKISFAFFAIFIFFALLAFYSCASEPEEEPDTIHKMIAEGRYDEAKALFEARVDINSVDELGNTALHIAAKVNQSDLSAFLIAYGADIEAQNAAGETPLLVAVKNNAQEVAKILTLSQANIFVKDKETEKTALELALELGGSWYDAMITPNAANIRNEEGETIVHYFAKTKNARGIDCCIKNEIPLSVKDRSGIMPLDIAFQFYEELKSIKIAAALLQGGAIPVRGDFAYFEDCLKAHNIILRFNDGQTPLHIAAISGHTGIVEYLLEEKKSLRAHDILQTQDISGNTPLHEAVRYGRVEIAKILLENGANINSVDAIGKTPLLVIIPMEKQSEMYKLLLEHKANTLKKDMFGDTVLHVATMSDTQIENLKLLCENGAGINKRNKQGVTPLAVAVERKNLAHIAFYVSNGADIHAEDQKLETPFTCALESEAKNPGSGAGIIETLITTENSRSFDSAGNSPLHVAIAKDASLEIAKYIIDSNADINMRNKDGNTALMLAVTKNRRDIGELLIEHNADVFISNVDDNSPIRVALTNQNVQEWLITPKTLNAVDGNGNTPLHYAAELRLDGSVIALIVKGANVNARNTNGETAIFSAIKSDSPSTVRLLAENGCALDVNDNRARDNLGNTAAHACVRRSAKKALKEISELGCNLNAQNVSGRNALGEACSAGKADMAYLLLSLGADVDSADATGKTALILAVQNSNEKIVDILIQYGANPQIQEMYGRNAYHEAAINGKISIIEKIRRAGGNPLSRDLSGESPLSLVLNTNMETINAILGNEKSIVDSDGNTPVHVAVEKGTPLGYFKSILQKGYPINLRNGSGKTPLAVAAEFGKKDFAKMLLDRGADPFLASNSGDCAVSFALKNAKTDDGKAILEAIVKQSGGAGRDMIGDGILHYAARIAEPDTVNYLLTLGLDRSQRNISGETPADMAYRWRREEIAKILQ